MKRFKQALVAALSLGLIWGDIELAGQQVTIGFFKMISEAEARVGYPATPGSVAGVARIALERRIEFR